MVFYLFKWLYFKIKLSNNSEIVCDKIKDFIYIHRIFQKKMISLKNHLFSWYMQQVIMGYMVAATEINPSFVLLGVRDLCFS